MKGSITSSMIKELRLRTGVGMSKCKDALTRAEGSIDQAIEILRKEGMASSVKKEGRIAKDGFIAYEESDDFIGVVEINCETDFVAQNEEFGVFLKDIAKQIVINRPDSLDSFLKQKFIADEAISVEEAKNILIQKFGEKIDIKRFEIIEKNKDCSYGIYSHMKGKIVTIVEIEGLNEESLAKDIAMHVAAERPDYLKKEDIEKDVLEKEKEIAKAQIKDKPEYIKDKIVEGKIRSFYDSVCLLNQKYVKDPSFSVEKYVESCSLKANKNLQIKRFWYWKIGQ